MSTLDKKVFYEVNNDKRPKNLIKSNAINDAQNTSLKNYSKKKDNKGYRVEYNFIREFCDKGRVYPEGGLSLCSFSKRIRGYLISNLNYINVDIKNCYPVLLQHLYNKMEVKCERLTAYTENRNQMH